METSGKTGLAYFGQCGLVEIVSGQVQNLGQQEQEPRECEQDGAENTYEYVLAEQPRMERQACGELVVQGECPSGAKVCTGQA